MTETAITDDHKARAQAWFEGLRDRIVAEFEAIECDYTGKQHGDMLAGTFVRTPTKRTNDDGSEAGGGLMSLMHGRVFEKVGVNTSTVNGTLSPEAAKALGAPETDRRFWASSISLIAHMRSPHVPAVHMNTRHMITQTGSWFGGGADLTPMYPNAQDEADFHAAMQRGCRAFGDETYAKYKKWCDEYFYLPHRKEPRGAGGIFYDRHNTGDWEKDFAFTKDVGLAFAEVYPQIVRRRMGQAWTDAERHHQLVKRGRYVEFNLMWDRGTLFGLKTGHNIDAILVSMPPEVRWP
ncbi:MAG: oxygen-dependent coproporphyrinogen oxidase [Alphaproteobacteria bacterium]|nr:oxygen-dependent coproporphyrinogen oxidase [Alphaproteobacteria bacterium]MBV9903950.1 oxygen-dependent coproporphyrinogen oxidase [Alphaproteobacteria bacterium]